MIQLNKNSANQASRGLLRADGTESNHSF